MTLFDGLAPDVFLSHPTPDWRLQLSRHRQRHRRGQPHGAQLVARVAR